MATTVTTADWKLTAWLRAAAAGLIVFGLALASITATADAGRVAVFWPANAVILAALSGQRRRDWALLLAAGFAGNLGADLIGGDRLLTAAGLSGVNTVEIVICALGLNRLLGRRFDISSLVRLGRFSIVAIAGAATAAFLAAVIMRLMDRGGFAQTFAMWTMADALGLLIVGPPLLMLDRPARRRLMARERLGGNLALLSLLTAVTLAVFLQREVPASFVICPLLVLVAFQAETAGAALGVLIVGVIAATASTLGYGPVRIAPGAGDRAAVLLQLFLLVSAATAFPVAAEVRRRRKLEEREAARADEYQVLADHTTDLILRFDLEHVMLYVSPSCRELGYQPADLIGRRGFDFLHPDDLDRIAARVEALLRGDPPEPAENRELRVRTRDGQWIWFEDSPQVVHDAGRAVGFVTQLRNIHARKAMEAELERRRAEAEAAAVAKSEFLANMSHEIRTPLTGILGFSGILQGVEGLPEQARSCADRITASGQALLNVVNDILDFSKIEAGQLELDPHPFDPAAFIAESVALVQAQAQAKGLALETRVAANLPALVEADAARLRQVLLNLLSNAIKFTAQGGVTVEATYASGVLKVAVTDTGVGVPADKLDRLFQRFSQADGSITRQFGGTGLGLAICKSLSQLMGGTVGVSSMAGQGSTFWFTVVAPEAAAAPEPGAPALDPASYAGPAARVLVVDDNPVNREVVKALLENLGLTISEAAGGAEAVERATAAPFDLILMDLQMPGMDGLAATRAIRDGSGPNRGVPIVALSANVLSHHLEACREAGMNDHIGKPINAAELLTKVAHWTTPAEAAHDDAAGGAAHGAVPNT